MEPTYIIELHPVKKIYYNGIHHGTICESGIKESIKFKSYIKAQKQLADIIRIGSDDGKYYISILKFEAII